MNPTDFSIVLQSALTPVALISGVGLLLLSMVNRYSHALDRTRQLMKDRPHRTGAERERLEAAIDLIYKRCRIMKNAMLSVSSSIMVSGFIVFATVLEGLADISLAAVKGLLLLLSMGLVVVGAFLFVIEVRYSLHAIHLEVESRG